jgi:hypothetical protein
MNMNIIEKTRERGTSWKEKHEYHELGITRLLGKSSKWSFMVCNN